MLNVYLLIRLSYLIRLCNSSVDALRLACVVRHKSTEVLQGKQNNYESAILYYVNFHNHYTITQIS